MDKYKPIKQIGKGSFGNALLVQPIDDPSKSLVMKIIDISKLDRKQKEEALNEVHVLKAMRHPYIVSYKESFVEKQCLCIVMNYADGGDLQSRIIKQRQKKQYFPEEQIVDWFLQICLALKHIHDRQILHRDIKAQNIFLTSKNEVKLGDFGIARILRNKEDYAKTAIGTPYYLSPEICDEKPYNQKSDIWSLGCILYEMVTLKHAFDGNTIKELMKKIMTEPYNPIPPQFSDDMKQLIAEMLIKDPNARPSIRDILQKKFLTKRVTELLKGTLLKHSSSELSLSTATKSTLLKNPSEADIHSRLSGNFSASRQSYFLKKPNAFESPKPFMTGHNQPTQSQETQNISSDFRVQTEISSFHSPKRSVTNTNGIRSRESDISNNYYFSAKVQQEHPIKSERMMTAGLRERVISKSGIKDRPKSFEKGTSRGLRGTRDTNDSTQYSMISEINNVIAENLSFINQCKTNTRVSSSFLTPRKKENSPYHSDAQRKILVTDQSRQENQTPEGDLISLAQLLTEHDTKKEVGNPILSVQLKRIVTDPNEGKYNPGGHYKLNDLLQRGDPNDKSSAQFQSLWHSLEEKLGLFKLQKAHAYLKASRSTGVDQKLLLKIIGDKNQRYIKDLEKLIQLKK